MMAGSFARFRRGWDGVGYAAAVLAAFAWAVLAASGCGDDRFDHPADPDAETDSNAVENDAGADGSGDRPDAEQHEQPNGPGSDASGPDQGRLNIPRVPVGRANRPPSAAGVMFTPIDPTTEDDLVASVDDLVDADGDRVNLRYTWLRDGAYEARFTSDRLPAGATRKGELWRVAVTPFDSLAQGPTVSADITIANSPPAIMSVTSAGPSTTRADALAVDVATSDPDEDSVELARVWFVNGEPVSTGETLAPELFSRGDTVMVKVTPSDGTDQGKPVLSEPITVDNTAPRVAVSLPGSPVWTDEIVCNVDMLDADGDDIETNIEWFVGDEPFDGASFQTVLKGDTISLHEHDYLGSSFGCKVSYNDGHGASGVAEAMSTMSTRVELTSRTLVGDYDYSAADVVVASGVTLTTEGIVTLRVRSFTMEGTIVGRGAGHASGELNKPGNGPGAGGTDSSAGSGGGGHAGLGGRGGYDSGDVPGVGGALNGHATEQTAALGSSGGSGTTRGGAGGGALLIHAEGAIEIHSGAVIDMRGADAESTVSSSRGGGGGAGGAIVLIGSTVNMAGKLDARGGNGASGASSQNDSGGGGGGGYVKLFYENSLQATGTIEISGGQGGPYGAAGPAQAGGAGRIHDAQID